MIHYTNFVMAGSLDEAYELNKKKSSVICGGFLLAQTSEQDNPDADRFERAGT